MWHSRNSTHKTMKTLKPMIGAIAFVMLLGCAFADDWPQYLGPTRNSISPQKGILRSWPTNGPEVLWTASVGRGFGGPVIKDGKVYLLDRDDKVGDKAILPVRGPQQHAPSAAARCHLGGAQDLG
jgi:hypothetical protein